MVFSSSIFLLFFLPIFLLLYWVVPTRYKNAFALLASILFYSWGAPKFVFLLLVSGLIDFYFCKIMYVQKGRAKTKTLYLLVGYNLALLAYFKYSNFFIDNLNQLLELTNSQTLSWVHVALPIGISFFTFQKISYIVDVYRNTKKPLKRTSDYLLFVFLFPQLIAGPIVRFNEIANEITNRKQYETLDYKFYGIFRFVIGLAKKVLIANVLGEYVDLMLGDQLAFLSTGESWLIMISYSLQIYYDFAGYSDMAIGLGMFMGFQFPENFNFPYISRNITEFWRRWHITLGTWMREYLYIPLGGNRGSKSSVFFNLWIVFLLSGLWHGDSWNFLIWGAFHGLFLILDRLFLINLTSHLPKVLQVFLNWFIVIIGWVFFRIETLEGAVQLLSTMFSFTQKEFDYTQVNNLYFTVLFIAITCSILPFALDEKKLNNIFNVNNRNIYKTMLVSISIVIIFFLSEISLTSSGFNPFIYFEF